MTEPAPSPEVEHPQHPGAAAAVDLAGDWEVDGEPVLLPDADPDPPPVRAERPPSTRADRPAGPVAAAEPVNPEQVIEAMLFVGGTPLTAAAVSAAVRGLTEAGFLTAIDVISRRYRAQNRPYAVIPRDGGYAVELLPAFRGLRDRLFGGPKVARLAQPALDCLAVIAYRQPIPKAEVDTVRGFDSGPILRQLIRLGLIHVRHRADADHREVRYGTTPKFLEVFGLAGLDELPQFGETEGP